MTIKLEKIETNLNNMMGFNKYLEEETHYKPTVKNDTFKLEYLQTKTMFTMLKCLSLMWHVHLNRFLKKVIK